MRGSEIDRQQIAVDKAQYSAEMEVRFNTEVVGVQRKKQPYGYSSLKNSETGDISELHPAGVFVFIGLSPNSKPFKDIAKLDAQGLS